MTPDQIIAWAASGESETLELKRTTGERREATRTLCAMLNHRGGRVLFGVEEDGRVIGQQVSDHTIEEVAQELRTIDPPALPTIDRVGARHAQDGGAGSVRRAAAPGDRGRRRICDGQVPPHALRSAGAGCEETDRAATSDPHASSREPRRLGVTGNSGGLRGTAC